MDLLLSQSMYKHLVNQIALPVHKAIWKLKLPLKIKVFIWFFMKQVILTEDNLFKKNWKGVETCCFCNNKETIQHLFFIIMWHILFGEWFRLLLGYDHPETQNIFLGLGRDK